MADALREFSHEVRADSTLAKKLKASGQTPGADGKYSTVQICSAIYGEGVRERLRGTKERANNWALRNALLRSETLSKDAVVDALGKVFGVIAKLVEASNVTTTEKRDILGAINSWRAAIDRVALKASKQIVATNGDHSDNGHADDVDDQDD
jgi:hypothetical protein